MAFTGEVFTFPGNCTYNFAYHCKNPPEEFSIQFRHSVVNNYVVDTNIILKIETVVIEINKNNVSVDGIL